MTALVLTGSVVVALLSLSTWGAARPQPRPVRTRRDRRQDG